MNNPIFPQRVAGARLRLRLVAPQDAAFVHGLRIDPRYNEHLSAVTGDVAGQRAWIERYKSREAAGMEAYYLIERLEDDRPCGTVRLYDIAQDRFTWGSWILNEDKPEKAALDSALISFGVGFEALGLPAAMVDVRIANDRARAFYTRLGMTELRRDANDIYLRYDRSRFRTDRATLEEALRG